MRKVFTGFVDYFSVEESLFSENWSVWSERPCLLWCHLRFHQNLAILLWLWELSTSLQTFSVFIFHHSHVKHRTYSFFGISALILIAWSTGWGERRKLLTEMYRSLLEASDFRHIIVVCDILGHYFCWLLKFWSWFRSNNLGKRI